jgi:potassium efflux system protein
MIRMVGLIVFGFAVLVGAAPAPNGEGDPITVEQVEAQIESLRGAPDVPENVRTEAIELLTQASTALARANQLASRAAQFRRDASEAPGLLERIRDELARPAELPAPGPQTDATLSQLEQSMAEAAAELQSAREQQVELQNESARRQGRRSEVPGQITQARQRLLELGAAVESTGEPGDWLSQARRVLSTAQRRAAQAEVEALEAELANYDARRELLPARLDLAMRRVTNGQRRLEAWQGIVDAKRRADAESAAREAEMLRRQAARQHPVLQEFAAENQRLAQLRVGGDGFPERIARANAEESEMRTELVRLRNDYAAVRRRIEASGLNKATGLLLRQQFEALPDLGMLRRKLRSIQRKLEDVEIALIERQEARSGAGDLDGISRELLERIDPAGTLENRADLEAVTLELVRARRDLLGQLVIDAESYRERLLSFEAIARDSLLASEAYASYIRERILWVQSISGDRLPPSESWGRSIGTITDASAWGDAGRAMWVDMQQRWPADTAPVLLLIGLFIVGPNGVSRLKKLADLVGRFRTDSYALTVKGLVFTTIGALPIPLLVWWIGLSLANPVSQNALAVSAGQALQVGAVLLLFLSFFRVLVCSGGLGEAHFKWPRGLVGAFRANLRWLTPVIVPLAVITAWLDRLGDEDANATIGRAAFAGVMLALSLFTLRVLRRGGSSPGDGKATLITEWLQRTRPIWFTLLVATPLMLGVLPWLGYYYSALRMVAMLFESLSLLLAVMILNAMLMRWLFIARRKVAVEDARRRREQSIRENETVEGGAPGVAGSQLPPVDEDKVDLPGISAQISQLFRMSMGTIVVVGLMMLWSDTLPALRMLDRVQVWPAFRVLEAEAERAIPILEPISMRGEGAAPSAQAGAGATPPTTGGSGAAPSPVVVPMPPGLLGGAAVGGGDTQETGFVLTLANLGLALLIIVLTLVAFQNVPGLTEMIVLQRLPLDAASRYALSTVIRYGIAILGISVSMGALGIAWSNIQWLAAALTFGLAFGLQEIFANFISGLIILAERPIRIGDTVTAGNTSGTVTRIRMRATTITDFDRKELIIPNKSFITGEVVNWTLSDPVLRVVIPIGLSYGADIERAESILLDLAQRHPQVLNDPKPNVQFIRFGDSTLDFELRVFIPSIAEFLPVRHGLLKSIIVSFREAGIEIAFPQRDLHIRSADALTAALLASRTPSHAGGSENSA